MHKSAREPKLDLNSIKPRPYFFSDNRAYLGHLKKYISPPPKKLKILVQIFKIDKNWAEIPENG